MSRGRAKPGDEVCAIPDPKYGHTCERPKGHAGHHLYRTSWGDMAWKPLRRSPGGKP